MKPLSKPLPATGRGFELGSLYDKIFHIVLRLEIWGYTDKAYPRRLILWYKLVRCNIRG